MAEMATTHGGDALGDVLESLFEIGGAEIIDDCDVIGGQSRAVGACGRVPGRRAGRRQQTQAREAHTSPTDKRFDDPFCTPMAKPASAREGELPRTRRP